MASLGADPYQFIKAQFVYRERHPLLKHLVSDDAIRNYKKASEEHGSLGAKLLLAEEGKLKKLAATTGSVPAEIVCDQYIDFSPVMRLLHCPDGKLTDMMEKYGKAAKARLLVDTPLARLIQQRYAERVEILLRELVDGGDQDNPSI